MTTFALVHGSMGGSWCWEEITGPLAEGGHSVIAVDLPCDDVKATFDDYAETVCRACADVEDDLVVVGHSLGGATIPLVAVRRPVTRLVFLASLVPPLAVPLGAFLAERPDLSPAGMMSDMVVDEAGSHLLPPDRAVHWFFHDCDPAVAQCAAARLRPQSRTPISLPYSLAEWPATPSTYIRCESDRALPEGWSVVAKERLGVDSIIIPGGHSPFYSDPAGLARLLQSLI